MWPPILLPFISEATPIIHHHFTDVREHIGGLGSFTQRLLGFEVLEPFEEDGGGELEVVDHVLLLLLDALQLLLQVHQLLPLARDYLHHLVLAHVNYTLTYNLSMICYSWR